jgi:hypothetical protein
MIPVIAAMIRAATKMNGRIVANDRAEKVFVNKVEAVELPSVLLTPLK